MRRRSSALLERCDGVTPPAYFTICTFANVCRVATQTQEREAKAEMRRKAKELQQARRDAERSGKKAPAFGGFGSAGMTSISSGSIMTDTIVEPEKPKISPAPVRYTSAHTHQPRLFIASCCLKWSMFAFLFRPSGPSKALKLGAKGKEVDNFVDKLKSEGETIMPTTGKKASEVSKVLSPPVNMER